MFFRKEAGQEMAKSFDHVLSMMMRYLAYVNQNMAGKDIGNTAYHRKSTSAAFH